MLATIPQEITHNDKHLSIKWKDGNVCTYGLLALRKSCPCAICKGGHGSNTISITGSISQISLVSWKKVGRYALCITWSDGHDKGIYTYDNLRAECNDAQ